MSKFSEEKITELKAQIRSILVKMPDISKYKLAEALKIDKDVALRLKKEVMKENAENINKQVLQEELSKVEGTYNEIKKECWRILSKGKRDDEGNIIEAYPSNKDIVSALRTLLETEKRLFDIKFDAGVFKRQLGEGTINLTDVFKAIHDAESNKKD